LWHGRLTNPLEHASLAAVGKAANARTELAEVLPSGQLVDDKARQFSDQAIFRDQGEVRGGVCNEGRCAAGPETPAATAAPTTRSRGRNLSNTGADTRAPAGIVARAKSVGARPSA
jgi:hypothetical protein